MRSRIVLLLLCGQHVLAPGQVAHAQELQLHYDVRHSVDPGNNPRDFPALVFKNFKALPFGSFLLKMEGDLNGTQGNVSKLYFEVSQSLRFWRPPIYAHIEYSGGVGLFDNATGGYYLENAYLVGGSRPFQWYGGWGSVYLAYKHTNFRRPSHDPQFSFYWGRAFRERWTVASTSVLWTQNRNHGDAITAGLTGKRSALLIENELWYRAFSLIAVGSEIRVSQNVYASDGRLLVYPTLGIRYTF